MQPFTDFEFFFQHDLLQTHGGNNASIPSSDEPVSPPQTATSSDPETPPMLDFTDLDLENFQLAYPETTEPQSIYEPISPSSESSVPSSQTMESISDRSSMTSDFSSLSPLSSTCSPASMAQSTSSASDESVQDALDALEKKLSDSRYAEPKTSDEESESKKDQKPECSYMAMIVQAILSVPEKKMILGDIYQYIMDNYPFYNNKERAWRNNVRYNLSLNACFVKSGRTIGGKGNYWSINPSCVEDFANGDYRRRQAKKRNRRSMKTAVKSVSDLPKERKETMPYVKMASTSTRNASHPYAPSNNAYTKMQYVLDNSASRGAAYAYNQPSTSSIYMPQTNSTSPSSYTSVYPASLVSQPTALPYNSAYAYDPKKTSPYASNATTYPNLNIAHGVYRTTQSQDAFSQQGSGYTYQIPQSSTMTQYNPLTSQGATSSSRPNTISYRPNNAQYQNNVTINAYGMNGNYYTTTGLSNQ